MSKILITGSSGSIGKALQKELEKEGHTLLISTESNLRIEDKAYFKQFEAPETIDLVYHLAAKTFVPDSWENPDDFLMVNIIGTSNTLEFCRKYGCKVIYISSYAYGAPQYLPIDEKHPVSAVNPYGLSKIMGEDLCRFYGAHFNIPYLIVRPFNIYSAKQNKALLIPEIIEQIQKGEKVEVRDLSPKRDYVFQEDLIRFLVMAKDKINNEVYNIGSGEALSVEEIISTAQKVWRTDLPVYSAATVRKNEIPETRCNYQKAKNDFGWEPKFTFEQGMEKIKSELEN